MVEANAVLSDPARRERYDTGEDEDGMNDSPGMGGVHMTHANLAEMFAQFNSGGGGGFGFGHGGPPRGHGHGFPF